MDRVEREQRTDSRVDQSLISAELVTEGNDLNTDDIREMLRSELQAELRNNTVQAEAVTPTHEDPPPPPPNANLDKGTNLLGRSCTGSHRRHRGGSRWSSSSRRQ